MIKRFLQTATVIAAAIFLLSGPARAERRVALVVGNSAYQTGPQLANPVRDASAVAQMFKDAGFDVVDTQLNVGNLDFKRAIRKFETSADQADIAVVYYAGHGIEIGGRNYLLPADAKLASDRDADDEAIPLERLVSSADGAKQLRLMILDACRDNPFVGTMKRDRKGATRGISAGLGRVEPTSADTLIAYAAKAGSTADDGSGLHSPFANAILKNLAVPGLDVRLAFGRVRDDVMKATNNRQEPFVYGAIGGGNVSLIPAPVAPHETSANEIRTDYELVQRIGSRRAWEVFLSSHPTGFYADLARAQIEALGRQQEASLRPPQMPAGRDRSARDMLAWDAIKDSTDPTVLQKFVKRFLDSPLALSAQRRIDMLARLAREHEAQRKLEQHKAEQAAHDKREQAERRAREAEETAKAKAAAAESAAQNKREDDERQAAAAEAARKVKEAEAAQIAQEAREKAEQAEREKAMAEAAAARAAAEQHAKAAETARRSAELAAAKEAACKNQRAELDTILAKGSEGTGLGDLEGFSNKLTCDRLGPVVAAALDRFNAEAAMRAATPPQPNSPELISSAQAELVRLGCFAGKPDDTLASTQAALGRYLAVEGQPTSNPTLTWDLIAELTRHVTRVCPLECRYGETLRGDACVAERKPARIAAAPQERAPRKPAAEAPRAVQEAMARPSIVSASNGHHPMIGVGF